MESLLAARMGVDTEVFHWVLVPLLIFLARIADVSISTIRMMMVINGRKELAPFIGFFESLIWLIAIGQILQNVGSVVTYLAYAGGFATGTYVGMRIEERMALGKVIVRIITQRDATALLDAIRKAQYRLTVVQAEGAYGSVSLIFTVINRRQLPALTRTIHTHNPKAFYTIENVRFASETPDLLAVTPAEGTTGSRRRFWARLKRR